MGNTDYGICCKWSSDKGLRGESHRNFPIGNWHRFDIFERLSPTFVRLTNNDGIYSCDKDFGAELPTVDANCVNDFCCFVINDLDDWVIDIRFNRR